MRPASQRRSHSNRSCSSAVGAVKLIACKCSYRSYLCSRGRADLRAGKRDVRMTKRSVCRRLFVVASCAAVLVSAKAEPGTRARGCTPKERITIAAVGDVIFQPELETLARSEGTSYRTFWRALEGAIAAADLAYANIEGPVAAANAASGPAAAPARLRLDFNYRPSLIEDMKASGFDIVSTANNHALDRGASGVDQTIAKIWNTGDFRLQAHVSAVSKGLGAP